MAKKNLCPEGFKEITPGENATILVALHNWEDTLEQRRGNIPAKFAEFFEEDAGGAEGVPLDKISDFAERLNTSLVCIKK